MIGFLRGALAHVAGDHVLIDVGGVGYRVQVPRSTLSRLPAAGQECRLRTVLHVREDALVLFGFATEDEQGIFEELLGVSGVGPKVALSVLSALAPNEFRRAVTFADAGRLQKVPGVGKKLAQRIALELKDKVGSVRGEPGASAPEVAATADSLDEAQQALLGLGYTPGEAGPALEEARAAAGAGATAETLVRLALGRLNRY